MVLNKIINKKKLQQASRRNDKIEIRESGYEVIAHEEYYSKQLGLKEDMEQEKIRKQQEELKRLKKLHNEEVSEDGEEEEDEDEDDEEDMQFIDDCQ